MSSPQVSKAAPAEGESRVAVLLVDTERVTTTIDERIYGHFLEHINHRWKTGCSPNRFAAAGSKGEDFQTYWESFSDRGKVEIAAPEFKNGKKSVRLHVEGGRAGIRQGRVFVEARQKYDGSLWVQQEAGAPQLTLRVVSSKGDSIASVPLAFTGSGWQESQYSFISGILDPENTLTVPPAVAAVHGTRRAEPCHRILHGPAVYAAAAA